MRWGRSRLVAVGAGGVLVLTGCTGPGADPPGAESAARDLARGLSSGGLADVAFASTDGRAVQRRWGNITAGMGETPLEVRLVGVEEHGDTATATLGYAWELEEEAWSYETSARLTRSSTGWQVDFEPSLVEPSLERGERIALTQLPAQRGDVIGAGGARLVTDRQVVRFGIDKTKVGPRRSAESARRLARLLEIDPGGYVEQVQAGGDEAFVEAIVLRADEVPPDVGGGYDAIPGALAVADEIPLAPTREFARPILGTVGPVTAEIIEESDGRYEVGDQAGLSGLQRRYEDSLAGRPGLVVRAEGGSSQPRELFRIAPENGTPLRTTLDMDLQLRAEQTLADIDPASALVAVRPSDGHVLAAADGPGSGGYPTATIGRYAPGSTFKVVTTLALLRAGLSPETVVSCPETLTVNGKSFKNYDDYPADGIGDITLRASLAHSCNTAFISERDQAAQSALADAAGSLGLGVDHNLGLPAYLGSVPEDAPETEHAASMIGQGKVLASPLAMAVVAASVAEGETVMPKVLVEHDADGASPALPLTGSEAEQLREMMGAVVTEGSAEFLGDLAGEPMLAKTGTAEFGVEVPPQTHAWMIAVQGDLAVAAFVEVGDSGSQTAGPVLEQFLRAAD